MRILGINLQTPQEASCAEAFLRFSPRVQFRYPHFVFCDIESTSQLFGGEFKLLEEALRVARSFAQQSPTAAIADSASMAQVFGVFRPSLISPPGGDRKILGQLPLSAILEFEGLKAWPQRSQIQHIIEFLKNLGLHSLDETFHLSLPSFRERWGELGLILWNRLHEKEIQIVSPLTTRDPLIAYAYFDEPVSLIPVLSQRLTPSLQNLFLRLEGLSRFAERLEIHLFCEYSDQKNSFLIEPVSPNRDQNLFLDLIHKKLESFNFENPIREFEIEIRDAPEKSQQLDFFEPRDQSQDRWQRLISFAQQADCKMGFLQMEASHFPEKSFHLKTDWPSDFSPKDIVEKSEDAVQIRSVYAKALHQSPRPSLLLKEALPISKAMMGKLKMLNRIPTERIESAWWEFSVELHKSRDYYFAALEEGQLLWIYQDRGSKQYYLQGYFD